MNGDNGEGTGKGSLEFVAVRENGLFEYLHANLEIMRHLESVGGEKAFVCYLSGFVVV